MTAARTLDPTNNNKETRLFTNPTLLPPAVDGRALPFVVPQTFSLPFRGSGATATTVAADLELLLDGVHSDRCIAGDGVFARTDLKAK